jgi:hypothetical protein
MKDISIKVDGREIAAAAKRGRMENRKFQPYPIQVGDLVCKKDEEEAVCYRVIRMPGPIVKGELWIQPSDPCLSPSAAKPEKVKIDDVEFAMLYRLRSKSTPESSLGTP